MSFSPLQQIVVVNDFHGERSFGDAAVDGALWADDDAFFVVTAFVLAASSFNEFCYGDVGELFACFFDGDVADARRFAEF